MEFVYVLKLADGKYYVGKTRNVHTRYREHCTGTGAAWTNKYPPISILQVIDNATIFEEDKVTREYMLKYGIDNVRGGIYSRVFLTDDDKKKIKKEIWSATDCCLRCGRNNHFITNCYANIDVNGDTIDVDSDGGGHAHGAACQRCGRSNHVLGNCYAKRDINGKTIEESLKAAIETQFQQTLSRSTQPLTPSQLTIPFVQPPTYTPRHITSTQPGTSLQERPPSMWQTETTQPRLRDSQQTAASLQPQVLTPLYTRYTPLNTNNQERETPSVIDQIGDKVFSVLPSFVVSAVDRIVDFILPCKRCGKVGHKPERCDEQFDINGNPLC
jgi:cellular nucleic acid-binding protein